MPKLRPLLLIGTRPEAIKMAPIVRECLQREREIDLHVCLTGQHREMLVQVVDYFLIKADYNLDLMQANQGLADLTSRCLLGIDAILAHDKPHCVVAQGDTTTVLAASLAATYRRIPFVHVEAGLRSGNLMSPWPEEMNRRMASVATALHCAPTERAAQNLRAEGVPAHTIHVTGNTVIDALLWTRERERTTGEHWRYQYKQFGDRRVVLITSHRRENVGTGLANICHAIAELGERFNDVEFVYPVHLNPNVHKPVTQLLSAHKNVHLISPVSYPEFVWLMDRSTLILTDSGGIQEEAPSLGKPVLVMRDATERPEAIEAGAAELVGTCRQTIVDRASALLTDEAEYAKHQIGKNPYGDGSAAVRIAHQMLAQGWHV